MDYRTLEITVLTCDGWAGGGEEVTLASAPDFVFPSVVMDGLVSHASFQANQTWERFFDDSCGGTMPHHDLWSLVCPVTSKTSASIVLGLCVAIF